MLGAKERVILSSCGFGVTVYRFINILVVELCFSQFLKKMPMITLKKIPKTELTFFFFRI